jgi:pyridoxamine 5'-phosphate oxidase
MILFKKLSQEAPYKILKNLYDESLKAGQNNIEATAISSYSTERKEVDSRYINLKMVCDREFFFFSNYMSPKSSDFHNHNQISSLIFWNSINVQIRTKATIKRTNDKFNQIYFSKRDKKKNALAISSIQSKKISSYNAVKEKYEYSLQNDNLSKCPHYWGGFSFKPYYFEFWRGHNNRLNKREIYELINNKWIKSYLQP